MAPAQKLAARRAIEALGSRRPAVVDAAGTRGDGARTWSCA